MRLHGLHLPGSPSSAHRCPRLRRLGHCRSNHQPAFCVLACLQARFAISRRDPFPLTDAFWVAGPPSLAGDDPGVSVLLPRFLSTSGHSDFSHSVPDDFTFGLYVQVPVLVRAGPYETSRGTACSFATVPPAHTLMHPGAPSISFAAILPARFSPEFWPTGSPCSATARWFTANPSDPTSRWTPCPAWLTSRTSWFHSLLSTTRRRRAHIPSVSCSAHISPSP